MLPIYVMLMETMYFQRNSSIFLGGENKSAALLYMFWYHFRKEDNQFSYI